MQPMNNQVPPGELPRPQYEPLPVASSSEVPAEVPYEAVQAQAIERAQGVAAPAPPPALPPTTSPSAQPAADAPSVNSGHASAYSPAIADDTDLIEKDWVTKAKQIVEETKDDPYKQTKEMNKMKADYLKKRYAKDLRLPEE